MVRRRITVYCNIWTYKNRNSVIVSSVIRSANALSALRVFHKIQKPSGVIMVGSFSEGSEFKTINRGKSN